MDIGPTLKRYKEVSKELKVKESSFVQKVLEKEKKYNSV